MKREVVLRTAIITVVLVAIFGVIDYFCAIITVSAATSNVNMSATINPSSTLEISANSVALDVVPSASGTFKASSALTVSAYTNSNYNCEVNMTTGSTSLTSTQGQTSYSIPTLTAGTTYTESTFLNDSWGYSLDATNYNPVTASNLITTFSSTTANAASVNFAAKLTQATKPGTYSGTVTFTTTCTPPPISDISELTYMQDFATLTSSEKSDVLGSMTTGTQYQLKDNRDQKDYYISKLADSNVWMTQNLDHDIVAQANYYTPQNTDIPSAWIPNTATYATNNTTWDNLTTAPESYDPGNLCWNGALGNYNLNTGTVACGNDVHMHIGNYYNWTAAVAMNDSGSYTTNLQDVDQSICPAGWRLPTYSGNKSYANLVSVAGFTSGTSGNIQNAPAYFVYGGGWSGGYVGYSGGYYGSVSSSGPYAYWLFFDRIDNVSPQIEIRRNSGASVRCVVR